MLHGFAGFPADPNLREPAEQTEQILNLIRFSMAWYIYKMLYEIATAQREGGGQMVQ